MFCNDLNIGSELAKLVKEAEQSKSEEEVWSTLKDQSKASSEVDTSAALDEEAITELCGVNQVNGATLVTRMKVSTKNLSKTNKR